MSTTMIFFLFIPLLSLILLTINIIFAPHNPYIEKNSAFECGFTSFVGQNRIQFSISFFIFALLFLLFDLEILLVYPYLISAYINEMYGLLILMTFLGILTIGFIFELGKKALTIDSKQTILSNYSLIKKSLSILPYTNYNSNSYDHFYHQLHNNKLIKNSLLFSSLYNIKFLFFKRFFYSYIHTLKDKFNYKWFISMVLAILFTYIFRGMLIYRLDSWNIDLTSIIGISISISSISVFFRSILHLIECTISYETAKMPMGPNYITDVNLKSPIDANNVFKKDSIDTEMKSESKPDEKLNLQNLPYDVRLDIAECSGVGWKNLEELRMSMLSSEDSLGGSIARMLIKHTKVKVEEGTIVVTTFEPQNSIWNVKIIPDELREYYEELIAYRRKLNYMVGTRKILVPEKEFDTGYVKECEEIVDKTIKRFNNIAKDAVWEKEAMHKITRPNTVPTIGERYKKEISEIFKASVSKSK